MTIANPTSVGMNLATGTNTVTCAAFTPTAGHLLVMMVMSQRGGGAAYNPSISDTWGFTWTEVPSASITNDVNTSAATYWTIVPAGTYSSGTVSAQTASGNWLGIEVFDIASGFDTNNPLGVGATAIRTGSNTGTSATFNTAPMTTSLVLALAGEMGSTRTGNFSSPYTKLNQSFAGTGYLISGYENAVSGGVTGVGDNGTNSINTIIAVEVYAAGTAPPVPPTSAGIAEGTVNAVPVTTTTPSFVPVAGHLMVTMGIITNPYSSSGAGSLAISDSWGFTWNAISGASGSGNQSTTAAWWTIVPAGTHASGTVTVTMTGGPVMGGLGLEVFDVAKAYNSSAPIGQVATVQCGGTTTTSTATFSTTPKSNSLILAAGLPGNSAVTWSSPMLALASYSAAPYGIFSAYSANGWSGSSVTMTYTSSPQGALVALEVLAPVASSPGAPAASITIAASLSGSPTASPAASVSVAAGITGSATNFGSVTGTISVTGSLTPQVVETSTASLALSGSSAPTPSQGAAAALTIASASAETIPRISAGVLSITGASVNAAPATSTASLGIGATSIPTQVEHSAAVLSVSSGGTAQPTGASAAGLSITGLPLFTFVGAAALSIVGASAAAPGEASGAALALTGAGVVSASGTAGAFLAVSAGATDRVADGSGAVLAVIGLPAGSIGGIQGIAALSIGAASIATPQATGTASLALTGISAGSAQGVSTGVITLSGSSGVLVVDTVAGAFLSLAGASSGSPIYQGIAQAVVSIAALSEPSPATPLGSSLDITGTGLPSVSALVGAVLSLAEAINAGPVPEASTASLSLAGVSIPSVSDTVHQAVLTISTASGPTPSLAAQAILNIARSVTVFNLQVPALGVLTLTGGAFVKVPTQVVTAVVVVSSSSGGVLSERSGAQLALGGSSQAQLPGAVSAFLTLLGLSRTTIPDNTSGSILAISSHPFGPPKSTSGAFLQVVSTFSTPTYMRAYEALVRVSGGASGVMFTQPATVLGAYLTISALSAAGAAPPEAVSEFIRLMASKLGTMEKAGSRRMATQTGTAAGSGATRLMPNSLRTMEPQ